MKCTTMSMLGAGVLAIAMAAPTQAGGWRHHDRIRGEGPVERQTREITDIDAVELGTIGTVFIEQGAKLELVVQAEENLLEYFVTDVRHRTLVINTERDVRLEPHKPIEFHVTVPSLEEVTLSSSGDGVLGDFEADHLQINLESSGDLECGTITCPRLEVRLESSGDLYVERWEGEKLRAELSSSGDLKIRGGHGKEQEVDINSSGDFLASDLETDSARVRTCSSGDAKVRVSEYLYARTSSSGDIVYYGRPEVDGRALSSGDIRSGGR